MHTFDANYGTNVAVYDSLTELRERVQPMKDNYTSGWGSGGRTMREAFDRVLHGVGEAETKLAQELMRKVNADFGDRHKVQNVRHVSGHRVNMGAYVSGNPNNMMKRRRTISHVAPIKMVIEVTVSAMCDDEHIQRRGAALAALATVVSRLRPVTLYAAWGLGGDRHKRNMVGMVKIPSTPLGISQAVAIMATEEMARKISFTEIHEGRDFRDGHWALGPDPQSEGRVQKFREVIGLKEDDVFIPGGHIDYGDLIIKDPVAWVHQQLEKQR